MFHCLVIKVLCLSVSQTARLLYHIHQRLSSTFFKFFSRYFDVCVSLSSDLFTLSHVRFFVNNYFCFFSKLFKLFNQKKQFLVTAQLEYHYKKNLSTIFLNFFYFFVLYLINSPESGFIKNILYYRRKRSFILKSQSSPSTANTNAGNPLGIAPTYP